VNDAIAAISTPFGEGAIAIVRLSGARAGAIADAVFRGRRALGEAEAGRRLFGRLVDGGETVDEVVVSIHRAPASYTGEDVVEINCHGGILVTRRILRLLVERGARLANPGEFTERAFLNGKMDLTQAEAVMDLITARTDLALRAAAEQLEGKLGEKIGRLREMLLGLLAHVEAYIDFPDEDIEPETGAALLDKLNEARAANDALLNTAGQGRILREGVRTVIYGAPNVGKSSLLNLLLGYERAIVSESPGTTRDTIEEVINFRGVPLRLVDTAGMRDSEDAVERAGIERTLKSVSGADLVLHLVDGSRPRCQTPPPGGEILVLNKSDLGEDPEWQGAEAVRISCRTGDGMERLGDEILRRLLGGKWNAGDSVVAINVRHQACLKAAAEACARARQGLLERLPPELIAIELRAALDAVGEVVGKADAEELLGKIFSTFCIGK